MNRWMIGLGIIICLTWASRATAQLPALILKDINGRPVDVSRWNRKGTPVILTFFATWCKPCLRELNAIRDVYPDWQEETGVELVAVSIDRGQDVAKVKPLADTEGWDYTVLLDSENELKQTLGVRSVPRIFILDGKGHIIDDHLGYGIGGETEIIEKIRELNAK